MHNHTDHHHSGHGHHHHHGESSNLKFALLLNLIFSVIEIGGGIWSNSIAVLSDALHDFGDSLSILLALLLHYISEKKRDNNYSYGYKRFAVLGAFLSSTVLLIGSFFIVYSAILRLQSPQTVNGPFMLILAIIGVAVNSAVLFRLRKSTSLNSKAMMLHHMEDVLGWVAVLLGSILIWIFNWYIIDPVLSICISVYILSNVVKNVKEVFKIFLQSVPSGFDINNIRNELLKHKSVIDIHDIHIWTMDGSYNIFTAHIVIKDSRTIIEDLIPLKKELNALLYSHGIDHITLAFESKNEFCNLTNC